MHDTNQEILWENCDLVWREKEGSAEGDTRIHDGKEDPKVV